MSHAARDGEVSRRELLNGKTLKSLLMPTVAAAVGVSFVTRFGSALGVVFPESAPAPAQTDSVPVRCPW
jgi:hypothetical protein